VAGEVTELDGFRLMGRYVGQGEVGAGEGCADVARLVGSGEDASATAGADP
jgi:hypothetical protein